MRDRFALLRKVEAFEADRETRLRGDEEDAASVSTAGIAGDVLDIAW